MSDAGNFAPGEFVAFMHETVSSWPDVPGTVCPAQIGDLEIDVEAESALLSRALRDDPESVGALACLSPESFTGGRVVLRERIIKGAGSIEAFCAWLCALGESERIDVADVAYPGPARWVWRDLSLPEIEARIAVARLRRHEAAHGR